MTSFQLLNTFRFEISKEKRTDKEITGEVNHHIGE